MSSPSTLPKQAIQLRFLNELSMKLQSLVDSEDFFQEIVDLIQGKFRYYSINIWSVDEGRIAHLEAQAGAQSTLVDKNHRLLAGEGIVGSVVESQKSYNCPDVRLDANYAHLNDTIATRSELTVPVLREGRVVAVLNIESDEPQAFDEGDVITLEAVAAQLSVAIQNQRLFQQARSFNRTLQTAVEEKTNELRQAQERILEQQRLLQKENRALKNLVQEGGRNYEIIGRSPAILSILQMVDKIAPTTATVLIQGESGTGKELIARRLHARSERAGQAYVTVNCGALQEALLESELFGHEKGSFTGAVNQKPGLCETAHGGTLFLDEIGEMSLAIQAKLLRFLQEGEFYRIGGKRPIQVDVRIISATNRDLEQEVRAGRFREDLYYRLNTITLRMPPLRKRPEDLPLLIDHVLKNPRFGGGAHAPTRVAQEVYAVLSRYSWPGNIRELQNTIERMKILADHAELRLEDVPASIRQQVLQAPVHDGKTETPIGNPAQGPVTPSENAAFPPEMPLEEVERRHILKALDHYAGNKTRTAQVLGITIKTLYNKLQRYGVHGQT
jgi:transcriptional regulator with GAF, ATPase, and Fis domain